MTKMMRGAMAAAVAAALAAGMAPAAAWGAQGADVYRVYNPNSGEHHYTLSAAERDHLAGVGWSDEGVGWVGAAAGGTPVWRVYNPNSGLHHYTTSAAERDHLVSVGWNDEGVGWRSVGDRPVYRVYNPNTGDHHYTPSKAEADHLASVGWSDEGVGWRCLGEGVATPPAQGGASSPSRPEAHVHAYTVPSTTVVHHDAVEKSVRWCIPCDKETYTGHLEEHLAQGDYSYRTTTKIITITPAYDEMVTIWKCSCGASKQ